MISRLSWMSRDANFTRKWGMNWSRKNWENRDIWRKCSTRFIKATSRLCTIAGSMTTTSERPEIRCSVRSKRTILWRSLRRGNWRITSGCWKEKKVSWKKAEIRRFGSTKEPSGTRLKATSNKSASKSTETTAKMWANSAEWRRRRSDRSRSWAN